MAPCKFIASSLPVLAFFSLSAAAQIETISEQSIKPYEDYHGGDIVVVSLVNGTLGSHDSGGDILTETDASGNAQNECIYLGGELVALLPGCVTLTVDDSSTQATKGQAKAQTPQNPLYQAPDKNNPKEVVLDDVIFNETGGLRANPKAKPGDPGSAENLHDARVAVAEIAERVLESSHPEREQAPHDLTRETVRDLNAGNKDVIRALNDSLSAARSGSNMTNGAMHFRTGSHKLRSLYGHKATMYFGPFHSVTGGRRYLIIAP
jgi:hypothetical protein